MTIYNGNKPNGNNQYKKQKTQSSNNNDNDNADETFNADDMADDDDAIERKQTVVVDDLEAEFDTLNDIDANALKATDAVLNATTLELNERAYQRPVLKSIDQNKDNIAIQLLECDNALTTPYLFNANGSFKTHIQRDNVSKRAVIRMYGVNKYGNSVLVNVHNFFAYLWVPVWPGMDQRALNLFRHSLNTELLNSASENTKQTLPDKEYVLKVEIEQRQSVWGYHFGELQPFIKITLALPTLIPTARGKLEKGILIDKITRQFSTYESNIPYVLRFMVDHNVKGGGWCEFKANTYTVIPTHQHTSHCQLEIAVDCSSVIAHDSVGEWLQTAPLRILSFDIECAGRKGFFPAPEFDSVITIGNVLSTYGSDKIPQQTVFTLGTCASIVGAHVLTSETEAEMLNKWMKFFVSCDADIVTGYNLINFDLPYLLNRAKTLNIRSFPYLGRIKGSQTTIKNTTFTSAAFGTRENKEIKIDGRIQFDVLEVVRREYKLRSYTLNAVSAHFLNQQKEDVHHSIITDLQNGNDETRRRLAVYCLKDALLPLRLMDKLLLIVNNVEMARVTGVPITYLLTRGQQIKVISQLYRKAKQHKFLIPVRQKMSGDDITYEGATVIEPKKAFYSIPIATLDFASLYPSIMMAHNLCYSTLIQPKDLTRLQESEYIKTPHGAYFVHKSKQVGLLPEILTELLAARAAARKQMKVETDPFVISVLNGRQLALKISANSVYGFTGATVGQLPCLEISSSVTGFGRQMITQTQELVEKHFTVANGYEHNADVIYGDTDSVMVKFGVNTVEQAMKLGAEAATLVSKIFVQPIKLEFEKVYYPYLLMNKKRYAGLYWTNPIKFDRMDTKGIETVRRDSCALVAHLVEQCLNLILMENKVDSAVDYAKSVISDLLQNKVDLSLLVISKSLAKQEYNAKQAHAELAARMKKRDPASAPVIGDRVAYVICKAAKGVAAYDKAEDPIYVLENDIPIDTNYYLTNQLQLPLTRLFEPILGQENIKSLFQGDHTRKITMSSGNTGIMKFAQKTRQCLGCKSVLKPSDRAVCENCIKDEPGIYIKQVERAREYEQLYARVWTQCQRCQGSLHQDVLCTASDCPIFYRRKKVQKDLQQVMTGLDAFGIAESDSAKMEF